MLRKHNKLHIVHVVVLLLFVSPMVSNVTLGQEELPPREKTLMMPGLGTWGASYEVYNPFLPAADLYWSGLTQALWEPLFWADSLTGKVHPILATAWEFADENYTEVIIYLNPNAKWSDGEPFTSDDVVFTYNMLKENAELQGHFTVNATLASIEAIGDYAVHMTLTGPTPRVTSLFYSQIIVPEHIWKDVDPTTFTAYPDPVSTGPYGLVSSSDQVVIWKRRDDYWGELPEPEYVVYKYFGSIELIAQELDAFGLDFAMIEAGGDIARELAGRNPYLQINVEPDACSTALSFNLERYPMNITEFRWALSYALNREKINNFCFEGGLLPLSPVPWPYKPALQRWASEDVISKYNVLEYPEGNKELAIQMLEDIGFTRDSEGWFTYPNGTRITLTLLNSPADWATWYCFGLAAQEDLREIGLDVTLDVEDVTVFVQRWEAGDWDLLSHAVSCVGEDPYDFFITYTSDYPPGGWYGNNERYKNPEFDQLVEELRKIPSDFNDPKARELVNQLLEIWLRDLPAAPVTTHPYFMVASNKYWTNWPEQGNEYWSPYPGVGQFQEVIRTIKSTAAPTVPTVTQTLTETVTQTTTVTEAAETVTQTQTTTKTQTVTAMDITSVAGAGIVALIIGVIVGWLVGKK